MSFNNMSLNTESSNSCELILLYPSTKTYRRVTTAQNVIDCTEGGANDLCNRLAIMETRQQFLQKKKKKSYTSFIGHN